LLMTNAVPLRPSHTVASSSKPFKKKANIRRTARSWVGCYVI
jgi:hypothetical protein